MARWPHDTARALGLAGLYVIGGGLEARAAAQDCSGTTFVVSAIAVTGLAVFDIATAPASARAYNERHVSAAPYLDPGRRTVGVSLSWSFGRSQPAPAPRKSPGTAFGLSFGSTAVPMAAGAAAGGGGGLVFLSGLVVGPSVGHFYAEQWGRGLATVVVRGVGTVVGLRSIIPCFD